MKLEGERHRDTTQVKGLSPEILHFVGGRCFSYNSRQNSYSRNNRQGGKSPTGSKTVSRCQGTGMNSGEPMYSRKECGIKSIDGKIQQNIIHWQSDYSTVSVKSLNGDGEKGIAVMRREARDTTARHRAGKRLSTKLISLTKRAIGNPKEKFTALAHIMDEDFLKESFWGLKRDKASGVDGVSVKEYESQLEENIKDLTGRLKAKRYRPKPAKRAYISKSDGSKRGLGIPTVEDKIVQMGIKRILEAIFETSFLDVSYGYRPNRNCHVALKALDKGIMAKPVNYVVEADIEKYFDTIDHKWLMTAVEQRIKDKEILRLIGKFLRAGIMENGEYKDTEKGTPQGGILSPLLANIYLHYILDQWFEKKVKQQMKGHVELIRYADDFVILTQAKKEAEETVKMIKERFKRYGLKISESKTKVVEFGRYAWQREQDGGSKVGTFDFLGITHYCDRTRNGKFKLGRKTSAKKYRQKLTAMNEWLKKVRNMVKLKEWWGVLRLKLTGHYRYYGISGNMRSLRKYYQKAFWLAFKWINRRSQKKSYNIKQYTRYVKYNPLPTPKIYYSMYTLST